MLSDKMKWALHFFSCRRSEHWLLKHTHSLLSYQMRAGHGLAKLVNWRSMFSWCWPWSPWTETHTPLRQSVPWPCNRVGFRHFELSKTLNYGTPSPNPPFSLSPFLLEGQRERWTSHLTRTSDHSLKPCLSLPGSSLWRGLALIFTLNISGLYFSRSIISS